MLPKNRLIKENLNSLLVKKIFREKIYEFFEKFETSFRNQSFSTFYIFSC